MYYRRHNFPYSRGISHLTSRLRNSHWYTDQNPGPADVVCWLMITIRAEAI